MDQIYTPEGPSITQDHEAPLTTSVLPTTGLPDIPLELWQEVVSYLRLDTGTLTNLSIVSKFWNHVSLPVLYGSIDVRDPTMQRQFLLMQLLMEDKPSYAALVRSLSIGICPSDHHHGHFIYDVPQLLSSLPNLRYLALLRTKSTPYASYSEEGNGETLLKRWLDGRLTYTPRLPTYSCWRSLRIEIPIGETIRKLVNIQEALETLEIWHAGRSCPPEDIFKPSLRKLALSGDEILLSIPREWEPTHLVLTCPESTSLWPTRFGKIQKDFLVLPMTTNLRSFELSSTLYEELRRHITGSNIQFPLLTHFGVFTDERVDEFYLQERLFLRMWLGPKHDPLKTVIEVFSRFPSLESLSVQPEGVADWTDKLVDNLDLLFKLRTEPCCPRLSLFMWRRYKEKMAGAVSLKEDLINPLKMTEQDILDYWRYI
ncbi:hypothetical protein CPB86DRAFT_757053 [Serendipita vermifera]|nr:hypothetical protein CPB86DRAFT_757053 [Serendipita vermifera]